MENTPAQIVFVSSGQINFVYPNVGPGITKVTVKNAAGQHTVNVRIAPATPSIFLLDGAATAAARNALTSAVVSASAPLHEGDFLSLYLTGLGATTLRDGFEYEGYAVSVARDGAAGLRMATEKDLDLIILDVMLPKMSGLDICKQLRSEGNDIPIILLTARGQEIDKVLGLKLGADDYVSKPFSFMELAARVAFMNMSARMNIALGIRSEHFADACGMPALATRTPVGGAA